MKNEQIEPFSNLDDPDAGHGASPGWAPGVTELLDHLAQELAIEYVQYLYSKKKLTKEVYLERFMEVSKVRSELGDLWNSPVKEMEAPPQPERGHGPNRLSIGVGVKIIPRQPNIVCAGFYDLRFINLREFFCHNYSVYTLKGNKFSRAKL